MHLGQERQPAQQVRHVVVADGVEEVRNIMVTPDSLAELEDLIERLTQSALAALDNEVIAKVARTSLTELVAIATRRNT